MRKNKLKEKLIEGKEMVTLCLLKGYAPLVEIAGIGGFDGIIFDAEHSTLSQSECEEMIRACEAVDTVPIIRTRKNEHELILRYLDAGAMGILVPNIRTKVDAENAVRAVKYFPRGDRGLSTVRANYYDMGLPKKEYIEFANEQTVVFIMVENIDAVNNLKDILEVDGIDGMMIGTTDLSLSMGYPGQPNHPDVKEAVNKALTIGLNSGKAVGTMLRPNESVKDIFNAGYRMLTASGLGFYKDGVKNFIKAVKGE